MSQTFSIDLEVAPAYQNEVLKFINQYYLLPNPEKFIRIITRKKDGKSQLSFTATDGKNWEIRVNIISDNPLKLIFDSSKEASAEFIEDIKEDIFFLVQLFEDNVRKSTLYFAWVEGEDIIPEEPPSSRKRLADRLLGSNLLLIYILFFGVNIVLFLTLGLFYAVAAILSIQLLIVLFSNRIFMGRNKWRVTAQNPYVHILEYQLPVDEFKEFQEKFGKKTVLQIKKDIYNHTLARGEPPNCQIGDQILEQYGFHCNPDSSQAKIINIYRIVKRAAESFNLPTPKIIISNTMIPNAAATGPTPNQGLVLITTGLLVQLDEEEILSVLGHEMGHLQGRDPLILFGIISGEFLLRFTLLYPLVLINPLLYIIIAMFLIFFVAKFFETRADLLSAMKIGQPQVLAEALRKIGYKRMQQERLAATRIPSWLSWDPHPPISFRVDRLEKMKTPVKIKNPLLKSAGDVLNGFKRSFNL